MVTKKKNKIKFPESFKATKHSLYAGATQWFITKPNGIKISIIGGGDGTYGDGVNTFEMWDFNHDTPQGYLTKVEINEYLSTL